MTSASLRLHSSPTEQGLVLLNYFPAITKRYSAALEGTRPQMQVLAFCSVNRSPPRQDPWLNLTQIRVAENHGTGTRYLDSTHQNTRPKDGVKKTGVNDTRVTTCCHTRQGTKQPCHEAPQLSSLPLGPQLCHPTCPTAAILRVHLRLWDRCSLKWLNLN